jgi:hypothetical protein
MTNTAVPTLTYDTPIRAASWGDTSFARTFTVRGYAIKNGQDPDAAIARAVGHGHALVGSIYSSGALVGDRAQGARMVAEERAIVAAAVTLKTGDTVSIDGVLHEVVFARGNEFGPFPVNSDPVSFIPVR